MHVLFNIPGYTIPVMKSASSVLHVCLPQVAKEKADAAEVAGEAPTDKSIFHGKSQKDYAGRSWLEAPKDLKAENEHCFLPKRWIHTWSGHTKGVNAIRYCTISTWNT